MLPKAHLTSHSRMLGSRWVITPLWLSGSWSLLLYSSSVYSCHLFLISSASYEWIRKLWYIYTMEYYSAIKKNAFESVLMRWIKLEPIIQSEVSQKDKHQYSILTHIYGILKDGNDNPIRKTEKETQIYRTDFWTLSEKVRVGCFKRTASKHVYYQLWDRSPLQVGCMRQLLGAGALGWPRGMRWGSRREGGSGWGIHVNPWLIHVNVWQKPLQYCN